MPKKATGGNSHVLDLRKAVIGGRHLHAANEPKAEPRSDAGTATEEERRLAAMFGGDVDDGLVLDARERGTREGSQR